MDESFELIDSVSGNLGGDYDNADDALSALVETAKNHGWSAIEGFSLMRIRGDDQFPVAMQDDLIHLVETYARREENEKTLFKAF
jgi:hypothetical protein